MTFCTSEHGPLGQYNYGNRAMPNDHSAEELIDFLAHAGERGLMPAATAQALSVATRNVLSVLDEKERADLPLDDIDAIIRRFDNKRARDFNPASLKEYGRRLKRAVDLYLQWREDSANFAVETRATIAASKKDRAAAAQRNSFVGSRKWKRRACRRGPPA